jgi:hypothetical protein
VKMVEVRSTFLPDLKNQVRYRGTMALFIAIDLNWEAHFIFSKVHYLINMQGTPGSALLRLYRTSELISLKTFTRGLCSIRYLKNWKLDQSIVYI